MVTEARGFDFDVITPSETEIEVGQVFSWLCRLRHHAPDAISIRTGVDNTYSIGFRLCTSAGDIVYEDRADISSAEVSPETWIHFGVNIPRQFLLFNSTLVLYIDMLLEGRYWFSQFRDRQIQRSLTFIDGQRRDADLARRQHLTPGARPGGLLPGDDRGRARGGPEISISVQGTPSSANHGVEPGRQTSALVREIVFKPGIEQGATASPSTSEQGYPAARPEGEEVPLTTVVGSQVVPDDRSWIDRLGQPQMRQTIGRILCLKLDHIGDMLVADLALRLLRDYFPSAHITLICGPWNVALARRLGIADEVIGIKAFDPNGAAQHDERTAVVERKKGAAKLQALGLGEFDIAIDLRIDEDTRELLKLFKARVYAGSGNLSRFPFLDVAVPSPELNAGGGAQSFRLLARDFISGVGFVVQSFGVIYNDQITLITLDLEVTGAKTPKQCGTSLNDNRLLGIGLQEIIVRTPASVEGGQDGVVIRSFSFAAGSPDVAFLGGGWALPERWGTWTSDLVASLTLPLSNAGQVGPVAVELVFIAHTNVGNPSLTLAVSDRSSSARLVAECDMSQKEYRATLAVPSTPERPRARSRPIALRAGRYLAFVDVHLQVPANGQGICARVLGTSPERVIQETMLEHLETERGLARCRLEFPIVDEREPVQFELGPAPGTPAADIVLVSVMGNSLVSAPARIPTAHMEHRLAQLVFAVALHFSRAFEPLEIACETALAGAPDLPASDPGVEDIKRDLACRKAGGAVLVGIGLGASKETKRWPFTYFLEFCELLLSRETVHLVFCGGPDEAEETRVVEHALDAPGRIANLCGRTPLDRFGEIVTALDLYVGYDTGPTHYAGKAGVRTFGIFAATHHPREWGPVGRHSSWLTHFTDCSPCYLAKLEDCHHGHACMVNLRPKDCWAVIEPVIAAVLPKGASALPPPEPIIDLPWLEAEVAPASIRRSAHAAVAAPHSPTTIMASDTPVRFALDRDYVAGGQAEFDRIFFSGWYELESAGRWSGVAGQLSAEIVAPGMDCVELVVTARVYAAEVGGRSEVDITSGGTLVQSWEFEGDEYTTQKALLPVRNENGVATLECVLHCKDAASPFLPGSGDDDRVLGICIHAFRFSAVFAEVG